MSRPAIESIAAECLANQSRLIARGVTGLYDETLRPLGLRVSQLAVLVAVEAAGPLSQGELGRALCMEKSTVSRNVDRLLANDWLASVPGADGRSRQLEVTRKGKTLLRRAAPAWRQSQRRTRAILGEAHAAALGRIAAKLRAADAAP